jgi:hypothetical protein
MQKELFVKSMFRYNLIFELLFFFANRFSDKTKNDFYHRDTFTKYSGKYDYVQLDYNPSVNKIYY